MSEIDPKDVYIANASADRYRARSIEERKHIFYFTAFNTVLNSFLFVALIINIIHHW